jgi:hypothetical protein
MYREMPFDMVKQQKPFQINAAVIMPGHLHSTAWMQAVEQCGTTHRSCVCCIQFIPYFSSFRAFGHYHRTMVIFRYAGTG